MSHLPQLERDLAALADRLAETPARTTVDPSVPQQPARRRRPRARTDRRPVRVRTLAAVALTAVAGGFVLAIASGGPGTLDVVEEAQAALAPEGGILHVVTVVEAVGYVNGKRAQRAGNERPGGDRAEAWLATDPPRWRSVFRPDAGTVAALPERGQVLFTEIAYGGGAQSTLTRKGTLHVVTGFSDRGNAARPVTLGPFGAGAASSGGTSLEGLRAALEAGTLRSDGEATIAGRETLRLSGASEGGPGETITYFVDPDSFKPVRAVYRWDPPDEGPTSMRSPEMEIVTDFEVFERLPATPANERLLEIQPPPGTRVERKTLVEARRHMLPSSPRPTRAKP